MPTTASFSRTEPASPIADDAALPRLEAVGSATGSDAEPETTSWRLSGNWTAGNLGRRATWRTLDDALAQATRSGAPGSTWDLRGITQLDHIGAQLLWNRWGKAWPADVQASDAQRALMERVARFTVEVPPAADFSLTQTVDAFGVRVLSWTAQLRGVVGMIGQLLLDLLRVLRSPRSAPWRDFSGHVYQMGTTALPITALVGFLIGVVLAYLMSMQLRQYGAESFIVNILGISLVRELGPLLAAILVAGRSGSAITAQIGVMQVTEEIDAMRVMGIPESFRLVLPRAMALALAMPLIGIWTTMASLAGGILAADLSMNITPAYFLSALPGAIAASNLAIAMVKCVVFGVLIALVGCHYGMQVKPNTESLGQGTTSSVVTSITVVILVDALFAIVFRNVGI